MAPWFVTSPAARALSVRLRIDLGVTGTRTKLRPSAFTRIADAVKHGEDDNWPPSVAAAVYGISDASSSGRWAGWIIEAVKGFSDWQMCSFIAEIATNCTVSGEVSRYVIDKFTADTD